MNIQDIYAEWEVDAKIEASELDNEALKIPMLHVKYARFFTNENMLYKKMFAEFNKFKLEKYIFYTEGPSKESIIKGWKFPDKGRILKSEVEQYLQADQDVIDQSLRVSLQLEKVDRLKEIIGMIDKRNYSITNAINFKKFMNGG